MYLYPQDQDKIIRLCNVIMEERILAHLLYISINITTEIIVSSFILKDIVYPYTLTNLELFSILTTLRMYLLIYFYVQQCSAHLYAPVLCVSLVSAVQNRCQWVLGKQVLCKCGTYSSPLSHCPTPHFSLIFNT